jgi:hypothetical protein
MLLMTVAILDGEGQDCIQWYWRAVPYSLGIDVEDASEGQRQSGCCDTLERAVERALEVINYPK